MHHNAIAGYLYFLALILCLFGFQVSTKAQYATSKSIWNSITETDKNAALSPAEKLNQFYHLKELSDKSKLEQDSVYSKVLLRIGVFEIKANKNYNTGFKYIGASLKINLSGKKGSSKYFAAIGYFNYGFYYDELNFFDKALTYYDSTINVASTLPDTTVLILYSKLYKNDIYFRRGDFQKIVEESTTSINYSATKKDSLKLQSFLNQRAQAFYYLDNLTASLADINRIIKIAKDENNIYDLASAYKIQANIFAKEQRFLLTDSLFQQLIKMRISTGRNEQVAFDYIDYGNFLLNSLHNYEKAENCFQKTIFYGTKDENNIIIAKGNINIAGIYLSINKFDKAATYCIKALNNLQLISANNLNEKILAEKANTVSDKDLLLVLLNYRTEILLNEYYRKKNEEALTACIESALVTDTLITSIRHIQSDESSKLYWRNYTREFYATAIQITNLAKKPDIAFYFMEKSRSALLNDKLNELKAAAYISKQENEQIEHYNIEIIETEQKLSLSTYNSTEYKNTQLQLYKIKSNYDQFLKLLEQKYPAYYQYKYADKVPTLQEFQQYLSKNNQSFVHYFIGDTTIYILSVTAKDARLFQVAQTTFNKEKLSAFLQFCANKQALNNQYRNFAGLSNSIYQSIFKPLQIPKGRVVISLDNIVIPFEALCTDSAGKNFLLNNYSFSYAYSARVLMKEFNTPPAKGNFLGFAPVSYKNSLGVVDLKNAATALNASASFYRNDKLFTHTNASRANFFEYAPSYSVVSIFSHAYADTTDNEPALFMQDSLIHLSELQTLNNPSTKLVLLSACQTNVGKNATGEGIYSLARGFAAAGIESVAATLWKADEKTIYAISEKFNEYLAEGMNKDDALQKAKLDFIQTNSHEKTLPYYWANMILTGNADIIKFDTSYNKKLYLWLMAVTIISATAIFLFIRRKHR